MTATMNPACPLCGLRFDSRPLLELHIREDHRQRARHEPGGTPVPPAPRAASPATQQSRPGPAMTGPRRVIHALRYVNDELMRASEAIIRSARAPQPRVPQPRRPDQATAAGNRDITERVGRAA
jgi:hypothetical protein